MHDSNNFSPAIEPAHGELAAIIGRTKGYLLTERTAHDAVNALATAAKEVITNAQGAGVSLITVEGYRHSVGATDDKVRYADDLQYTLGEGPCLEAWSTGKAVYVADTFEPGSSDAPPPAQGEGTLSRTGADKRWFAWSTAAAEAGIRSCLSVPLRREPEPIGAIKVYSDLPDAFTDADRRLLTHLAVSAVALLGHIQTSDTPQRISDDVKASLTERDTIGIARGILMERHGLDRQSAFRRLIDLATIRNATIGSTAQSIVEGPSSTGVDVPV